MKKFKHSVEVRVDDTIVGTLELEGNQKTNTFQLKFTQPSTGLVFEVVWNVDWKNKTLSISPASLNAAPNGVCLAGCLIGAGAALARCLMKARSEAEVWKCLDEHAGTAGIGVVGCVIGCLAA